MVVGTRAVAGAGCIKNLSPPYNKGDAFDPRVEGIRNESATVERPDLVPRYVAAAETAACDMAAHDPGFAGGTLDFGETSDHQIALIEVNPPGNFGLYAIDYSHILRAIVVQAATQD